MCSSIPKMVQRLFILYVVSDLSLAYLYFCGELLCCSNPKNDTRLRFYLYDALSCMCTVRTDVLNEKNLLPSDLQLTFTVYNRTNSYTFTFRNNKAQDTNRIWSLTIPRKNITINKAPAPLDQFYIEIKALKDQVNDQENLKGTLLDVLREPMLQWKFDEVITLNHLAPFVEHITELSVSQSPCARDVAVICPIFGPGVNAGVVLGITKSGFTDKPTWYNLTNHLCSLVKDDCGSWQININDVKLANTHLFLLTNKGLFISRDLLSISSASLQFTLLSIPALGQVDYTSATLWYSFICLTDHLYYADNYVSLVVNTESAGTLDSRCVFSRYPFMKWTICHQAANGLKNNTKFLTFLYDPYKESGLLLNFDKKDGIMVSVINLQKAQIMSKITLVPKSTGVDPVGLFLQSNQLFVYGSEVWSSSNRGTTFRNIFSVQDELITRVMRCILGEVIFRTNKGNIYLMKEGLNRYIWLNLTLNAQSFMFCDHTGALTVVSLIKHGTSVNMVFQSINVSMHIEKHKIEWDSAIAIQYTPDEKVFLHEFDNLKAQQNISPSPRPLHFSYDHVGKNIFFRKGGEILITEVYPKHYRQEFVSSVYGEIIKPIKADLLAEESIQQYDLVVNVTDNVIASVDEVNQDFEPRHIGKTLVATGGNSYLITGMLAEGKAVVVPAVSISETSLVYKKGDWLIISSEGKSWNIGEGQCRYTLESLEGLRRNSLVRINVREKLKYTFQVTLFGKSTNTDQTKILKVFLSNPSAMKITTVYSDDNTQVNITAYSNNYKKAMTIVTVSVSKASLLCSSSSFTFILKNSCPEGLKIVFLPSQPISDYDWVHGEPLDNNSKKRLFELPVNYRPPSQQGIYVPTSENIYNADPSKPIPRQRYLISRLTGRYKQCAGKTFVNECGCTDAQRVSPLASNSDCRQKVLRLRFPLIAISMTLYLRRDDQPDEPLLSPYFVTVTEVNNRTDWKVKESQTSPSMDLMRTVLKDKLGHFYNPEELKIILYGPELFHFQISVIPGMVMCNLTEEVQVYLDKTPPDLHFRKFIIEATGVVLAILLPCLFLFKYNASPKNTKTQKSVFIKT